MVTDSIARIWKRPSNRQVRVGVGLMLCAALGVQCRHPPGQAGIAVKPLTIEILPAAAVVSSVSDPDEQFARKDPLGFLRYCREQYDKNIRDYRCTFMKQERVGDKITPEQVTDVRCRQNPFSVDMVWTRNADLAARALYVAGRWTDAKGNELAWVRPAGALLRWMKLKRPIHGSLARKTARRTIDQFGFRSSLDLIIRYSEKAAKEGTLDLTYLGQGQIEGRRTYVFERRLPYTGEEFPYPDRLLIVHIDQEWLVPTGCFSYADDEGTELLGRYVLTDVELNPGYTDRDFNPKAIGF